MSTPAANPAMMKAMSHPLRWRIIAVVNGLGHARATDIASEHPDDEAFRKDIASERPSQSAEAREWWLLTEPLWREFPELIEALRK